MIVDATFVFAADPEGTSAPSSGVGDERGHRDLAHQAICGGMTTRDHATIARFLQ